MSKQLCATDGGESQGKNEEKSHFGPKSGTLRNVFLTTI